MPERTVPMGGGVQRGSSGGTLQIDRGAIVREPSGRILSSEPYTEPPDPRSVFPGINQQSLSAYVARSIGPPYYFPNQATATNPTQPDGTFYGKDDPYRILSDVFRNVFGPSGDVGRPQQTGQALVPVSGESGGGGSNILLLLLVLGGVGFAVYYFYFRKKRAEG